MAGAEYETQEYDVVVIGAGGAGLRAAIEASALGARTALVCKSLLGKAPTVMAEGGIAAAMGNVHPADNWKVHFRDTMRGGKSLSNWRMAQIHAQEASERVLELEQWGALFDRTQDGLIRQRNFGGHRYARLACAGARTGLEMIRTLQQHAVHKGIDVHMECSIQRLLTDGGRISGAFGYLRGSGKFIVFESRAVVLATGGGGRAWRINSNSPEQTGDGMMLAMDAGAQLVDMEFVQFHPTGMVWPPSVHGMLVTEGVRWAGGTLRNVARKRFMFDYVPALLKAEFAATENEADAWYEDQRNNRCPPDLLPADVVARAIHSEIKAGRGTARGGVFLDLASRRPAEHIRKHLSSTYRQFKQLADVDITRAPMEVAPTCHYAMGGIRVDAETTATTVPGLFAAGEVAAGLHGANRIAGNSLSDLLVFGRRAGQHAARYAGSFTGSTSIDGDEVDAYARELLAPFGCKGGENSYDLQRELQNCMQALVGIVRVEPELELALGKIRQLVRRARNVTVQGQRPYNSGWHLRLDLRFLLLFAEAVTLAAIHRKESRGSHARSDFPGNDAIFAGVNIVIEKSADGLRLSREPLSEMPHELKQLLVPDELKKLLEEQYKWMPKKSICEYGAETPAAASSKVTD